MREPRARRPHMPGYGLLPADAGRGLLPFAWAVERLEHSRNYWLATSRPDGRPHCMAVWAVWLDGALWLSTGAESRKARNLAARADCVVTTERADEPVVIEGRAERVLDPAAITAFQDAYEAKYAFRPTTELGPIFRIAPRRAFGFIEDAAHFAGSATRWSFG